MEEAAITSILVVDDEETILNVWSRVLSGKGYEVFSASDGHKALEIAKSVPLAVIFSDINMPGVNGRDFLKHLRSMGHGGCVNIVTGESDIPLVVECMQLGACGYLQKPCENEELAAVAARCIRHQGERQKRLDLEKAVARYEDLDRLKTEFISNVSHEFRTPLFAIQGAFDLLSEQAGPMDASAEKLKEVVKINLVRLGQLVVNLLNFSRLEKETLKPHFEPNVDVIGLAREVVVFLNPLAAKKGVLLTYEGAGAAAESLRITADPDQIRQLLINLVGNAIKFTPARGKVIVSCRQEEGQAGIIVEDTGAGVDSGNHLRIFERFYQVDGSITREAPGAGIGLAIVQEITRLHGGRVWVESEEGKGSRFRVRLPLTGGGKK